MPKLKESIFKSKKTLFVKRIRSQMPLCDIKDVRTLAKRVGLSGTALYNRMKGKTHFSQEEMIKVCTVLRFSNAMKEDLL